MVNVRIDELPNNTDENLSGFAIAASRDDRTKQLTLDEIREFINADFEKFSDLLTSEFDYENLRVGSYLKVTETGAVYEVLTPLSAKSHVTTNGGVKLRVVPIDGRINVNGWGLPQTTTTLNKAVVDLIDEYKPDVLDFQYPNVIKVVGAGVAELDDTWNIFDATDPGIPETMGMDFDFGSMYIMPTDDSTWGVREPLMVASVRNCEFVAPGRDMKEKCSGILVDRLLDSNFHMGGIGQRQADEGYDFALTRITLASAMVAGVGYVIKETGDTDFTQFGATSNDPWTVFEATGPATGGGVVYSKGECDNSAFFDIRSYEEIRTTPVEERKGIGLFNNCADMRIYRSNSSWTKIPLLIGPGAAEVFIHDMHHFNGAGLGGGVPVIQNPNLIHNHSSGAVYIYNAYADNGTIHDFTGGNLKFMSGRFLEFTPSANIEGARVIVYCTEALNGARCNTVMHGFLGASFEFRSDPTNTYHWGGDMTALNDMKLEEETETIVTQIARRVNTLFTGIDGFPSRHFRKPGGAFVTDYRSGDSGILETHIDPANGQYRIHFPLFVSQGDVEAYRAPDDEGVRNFSVVSQGEHDSNIFIRNGDLFHGFMKWDAVSTEIRLGSVQNEDVVLQRNLIEKLRLTVDGFESANFTETSEGVILKRGDNNVVFGVRLIAENPGQPIVYKSDKHTFEKQSGVEELAILDETGLTLKRGLTLTALSADPADPAAGESVEWVSDGSGSGSAGDVMRKINVGGTVKTVTVVDFSAA